MENPHYRCTSPAPGSVPPSRPGTRGALLAVLAGVLLALPAAAQERTDAFLAGYVTATLEHELDFPVALRGVRDGVVSLERRFIPQGRRAAVSARLGAIRGVREVRWVGDDTEPPDVALAPPSSVQVLPSRPLFEPILAGPRWPHFSAAYHGYRGEPGLQKVGTVSLGGALPLIQGEFASDAQWGVALHGAVFSIFDLDADSLDLVNSDFWVGVPVTWRFEEFSAFVRIYHQSSHLGDEFLLRNRVDRVNLSYEAIDSLVSYEPRDWLRVYGGAGLLLHREPGDLERESLQAGIELTSPRAFAGGTLRPVAALDVQSRQEFDWRSDYSIRAGVQVENPLAFGGRRLQLLGEYFSGHSPNGQFFERKVEYLGFGVHLHY